MTREQFISLSFIVFLIWVVYQVALIFSPFFRAIFWSAILTFAFYPIYEKLRNRLNQNHTVAAALMTVLIFLIVIPPVIFVIVNITTQAIELYQIVSSYIQDGRFAQTIDRIRSWGPIASLEARVFQWEPLKESVSEWMLSTSRSFGNSVAQQAGNVSKNILLSALNTWLLGILLFVFLRDGEKIYQFIYNIAPLEEKNKRSLFQMVNDTFAAVIRGQLLTSLVQGTAAGIIFWILGIPIPLFFAFLTFFISLIPIVGAASVWVPLVVYLVAIHENVKAVILFIFGILVISLIDNFMKPALIGERTRLPYFLLFFGIFGGIKLYGLMGIFLAPVVLSLFLALSKIYREKFLQNHA